MILKTIINTQNIPQCFNLSALYIRWQNPKKYYFYFFKKKVVKYLRIFKTIDIFATSEMINEKTNKNIN